MLHLETPTVLRVEGHDQEELKRLLTYRDLSADFELRKFKKNNFWHKKNLGEDAYEARLAELKAAQKVTLLWEDEKGLWTLAGFEDLLVSRLGEHRASMGFDLPEDQPLTLLTEDRQPRPYQEEGNEALIRGRHAAVEIGTGLGKSFMAQHIIRHHGRQTIIMAPSTSIAEQLYDDLVAAFGKSRVGFFGDGKKEFKKLITVGIAASLTRIEPGTPAFEALCTAQVFIADESHQTPAKTFMRVCLGVAKAAPYRYFFSGTQMRGDGKDLLLEGITGPIVFRMTVQEGVEQKWLARPFFKIVNVHSKKRYVVDDADKMTRAHLYYNDEVLSTTAALANQSVSLLNQPTLILIEEYEQFQRLHPLLKHPAAFAHGAITKENRDAIPAQYHNTDNKDLVKAFNRREVPILVGTSCISTGTDIQPVQHLIYLRGGKSETQARQAVGRGTRMIPGQGKEFFNFTDFRVKVDCYPEDQFGPSVVERHLEERKAIYEDIYPGSTKEVFLQ